MEWKFGPSLKNAVVPDGVHFDGSAPALRRAGATVPILTPAAEAPQEMIR